MSALQISRVSATHPPATALRVAKVTGAMATPGTVSGLRIARISGAMKLPAGAGLRVAQVTGSVTVPAVGALRVARVFGSVTLPAGAGLRVAQVVGVVFQTLHIGADQTLDAGVTGTLTATSAAGGTWSQVSGPAVALVGTEQIVTYTAPLSLTDVTLVFQYATPNQSATVTHTVLAATERLVSAGASVPVRFMAE